jgi:CBS domain-containing protein
VSRRGYHLSREYAVDPLETQLVQDVMRTRLIALSAQSSIDDVRNALKHSHGPQGQQLYPVLNENGSLCGAVTRSDLMKAIESGFPGTLAGIAGKLDTVAYPDESLRAIVYRMAGSGITRFVVTDRATRAKLAGIVSLEDLLRARSRNLNEERTRERVLRVRIPFSQARQA